MREVTGSIPPRPPTRDVFSVPCRQTNRIAAMSDRQLFHGRHTHRYLHRLRTNFPSPLTRQLRTRGFIGENPRELKTCPVKDVLWNTNIPPFRDVFTNSAYFLRLVLCRKAPRRIGHFSRHTRRGPYRIPLVASSDTCAKCFRFTRSAGETYRRIDDGPRYRRGHKDADEYGRDDGRSHPPITPGTRLRWVRYGSRTITRRRPEVRKTRWRSATGVDDVSRSLSNMLCLTV